MSYKSLLIITSVLVSSLMMQHSFAQKIFSPLQNNFNQLEQMIGLRTLTYEESIPYQIILTTLEASCSSNDIQIGQQKYTTFITKPSNSSYFGNKSKIKKMLKFNSIRNLILRGNNQSDNSFCVQKYFLYQVLHKIQDPDPFSYPLSVSNNSS